ncbi:MAG: DNA repair protein RecN [Betaproteobacteria bacterium]|nr:DNA repair protein RecN [Betaproteobacteria bacterium]
MLRALAIRDFVIVDSLELEFEAGFSALTGETGAGKSILIDALGLLLGDRAEAGVVRPGRDRAELSAEFDIGSEPAVAEWLGARELADPDDGACLVRRVIDAGGRSRAFINGRGVTLGQLRELGEQLVDIHGQHSHQSLARPAEQRAILDGFGAHDELLRRVAAAWQHWQSASRARQEAERGQAQLAQRREELEWQTAQLATLAFDADDWQAVNAEHARLGNAAALIESAEHALAVLGEGEGSALAQVSTVLARLRDSARVDREAEAALELMAGADAQLKEAARELRHYRDRLDIDPARLRELDARIEAVQDAARRFRVPPAELGELQARLEGELRQLDRTGDPRALAAAEAAARTTYKEAAVLLTRARQRVATRLGRAVTEAMQTLAMEGGRFEVALLPVAGAGGAASATRPAAARAAARPAARAGSASEATAVPASGAEASGPEASGSSHGDETVEFRVSANPGMPLAALAAVASGGELSRISLALRKVTSAATRVPLLVFDEVDAGIGGGVAEIVGRLLRELGRTHQVMCVTHLPQVAASAERQFHVVKRVVGGQTVSRVEALDAAARIEEIARMLGGVRITATTRQHADELLRQAREDAAAG